ncbi:MAG: TonB-dependent receptor [Alphaproteobacteria bacterium]|nr:TonB-dependent receptor [Alphaproteobacteria bacterium]MBU1517226.1 TonB-dependent receptor [Alphaproteobacteria bacterium]MBU2093238.1 TonB-dependent receptor [Alphaproteobacteria bacterium]MBU2153136.1 TonB-dependent receptor [Alphaproteobacteria bacterium]MBU2307842.1 TonB-dependent receptor [Alphaproteobacteria bacterium]
MRTYWLLGAALGAMAGAAQAADGAAEVDELVVTGARLDETLPQELSRYGSDLETITGETVRRNAYVDVSQALQMQTPGLFISPRNGPFSYADISLQGSRTGDVLWLVDGVRINNRLYTSTSPADTLPASMVERIEVLKGGQSLFYGTQAAAGVINVVTRAYSDALSGNFTVGGDTNQGVHANAMVRGAVGQGRFVAWVSKDEADGYKTFDVFQPSATARKRGYDVVSFGGKLGFDLTPDLKANLYYQHTDAHLDYPGPRLTRLSFNDRDEEIASASLDWTASEQVQLSVKGYYHDWDSVYSTVNNVPGNPSAPGVIVDDLTYWGYEDYGVSVLAKLNLQRGFEVDLGYDFQNFNGRDEVLLIAPQTEKVHAFIAQVRTTDDLFENAHLAAGVRFNKTDGHDKAVWNLSGRWDVTPAVYLEGMLGTSFILPSAEQLYAFDPCCAVGNTDLKPEQSLNGNIAIGGQVQGGRFTWQLTGFARKIDDLIVDVYDLPAFPDGIYVNVADKVKTRGVELNGTAQLMDAISARASYTYTRTRAEGAGRQFDRIPEAQAKATIQYDPAQHPFGASASLLWVGDVSQTVSGFGRVNYGDYVVADVAAYVFIDKARKHRVTARLENAFDEDYATRVNSAAIDLSTQRFFYRFRGVPRTLHVSYAYNF